MLRQSFVFIGLFLISTASAAHADDTQLWTGVNFSVAIKSGYSLHLDGQARFSNDASHLGQALIRPSLSRKLSDRVSATIGYVYIENNPEGPGSSSEQRLWQQLSYTSAKMPSGLSLSSRSRVEQRWAEGGDETGWRLRQQVRLTRPIKGSVIGFLWSEVFLGLNETRWGQPHGLDRWRNAAGLSFNLNEQTSIEPSYIHQRVYREGPDKTDHIVGLTLHSKF